MNSSSGQMRPVSAILLNDTIVDHHHGCTTVMESFELLCRRANIEIIARAPAHSDWRRNEAILSAAESADLVLVNGEGTVHHDRPAGKKLLEAGAFARAKGLKSALLNATWQANGAESIEAAKQFDLISVRESASQTELSGAGIQARKIPDLALYHQPQTAETRSGAGYCDSVLGPSALKLYRKMWSIDGAGSSASQAHVPTPIIPLPIVHMRRDPYTALRWMRRFVHRPAELLRPSTAIAAIRATSQDLFAHDTVRNAATAKVAQREVIVTGRFHMLIFCLAAQTPMLVLASNTHKNEATLADAGLQPWRIVEDIDAIDPALLARAAQWHGTEHTNLVQFLAEGRAAMEQLFCDLASMAAG